MSLAEIASPRGPALEDWPAIVRISVTGLFGRYSYSGLSLGRSSGPDASVALLYGDNGSGKTTLLKLLYSCLCPADNEGHRTYLSRTRFGSFKVEFRDGSTIEIVKDADKLVGSYVYRINRKGDRKEFRIKADKDYIIRKADENTDIPLLHKELANLKIDLLFLQDDRTIKSTYQIFNERRYQAVWQPSEIILREAMLKSGRQFIQFDEEELIEQQSPEGINLSRVIGAVGEWLRACP